MHGACIFDFQLMLLFSDGICQLFLLLTGYEWFAFLSVGITHNDLILGRLVKYILTACTLSILRFSVKLLLDVRCRSLRCCFMA